MDASENPAEKGGAEQPLQAAPPEPAPSTLIPYWPGTGAEGDAFRKKFCDRCEHGAKMRKTRDPDDACPIALAAGTAPVGDPDYPAEWVRQRGDPTTGRCTAFQHDLTIPAFLKRKA